MRHTRARRGRDRGALALAALGLGAFAVGTTELLVVGVLDLIAEDMAVSVSSAGQLVTAYALGISIGAPILTALTTRLRRRELLLLSLAAFVAGNLLALAAVGFDTLVLARGLTGALHGLFVGVAFVVAAGLVAPKRQGSAMSVIIGGIAVSTVVGVPLGTLIGQLMGWRAAFTAIVALGALALAGTLAFVPQVATHGADQLLAQARSALARGFLPCSR
jgi:DHA1 family inner membrane transport protein